MLMERMRSRYTEIGLLLAILVLGAFLRFYRLHTLPYGLYPDEAMNGTNALQALHTGDFKLFYQENNGREGLFINIQALSIKLFGTTPWSLRAVSAFFGTLTILGLYLLTKELFSRRQKNNTASRIALVAAFFLATSYWHINFSRIGFRAIMLPLFLSFGLYYLIKGLRTGNIWSLAASGIFIGAGFHSYIAFRFVPFIIAVPILWYGIKWHKGSQMHQKNKDTVKGTKPLFTFDTFETSKISNPCIPCAVTLFLFITFVVALPIGVYFLKHPEDFFGRSKEVSVFSSPNPILAATLSTAKTLQMFNLVGDCNPRHNYRCSPELFWPVGVLFLIGIWLAVKKLFRRGSFSDPDSFPAMCIAAVFFFMLFPVILTKEGLPHALRAIGLILPAMMFSAWGGIWLYDALQNYFAGAIENPKYARYQNQLKRITKEITILSFALILFIAASAYNMYFIKFAVAPENDSAFRSDLLDMARYAASLPRTTNAWFLANYPDLRYGLPLETEVIKYITDTALTQDQNAKNIHYIMPQDLVFLQANIRPDQKTAVVIMNPGDKTALATLKQLFPFLTPKVIQDSIIVSN